MRNIGIAMHTVQRMQVVILLIIHDMEIFDVDEIHELQQLHHIDGDSIIV